MLWAVLFEGALEEDDDRSPLWASWRRSLAIEIGIMIRGPRAVLIPQGLGERDGINLGLAPPRYLVPRRVQISVVRAAQRHGELIADPSAKRPGLGEA